MLSRTPRGNKEAKRTLKGDAQRGFYQVTLPHPAPPTLPALAFRPGPRGILGHVVFERATALTKSPPPSWLSRWGCRDVAFLPSLPSSLFLFLSRSSVSDFRESFTTLDLRVGPGAGSTFRQSDVDVNSNGGRRRGPARANVER